MAVHDTLGPTITLEGGNPIYVELGTTFADPGATGNDLCAGPVPVVTAGTVNANTVGTNTLTYSATDGNGNTNFVTRAVIVHDTTPPTILWSFTNLVLAAGTNCDAVMPDVTTTNFILAADLSGTLTYSQTPTNNARLQVGTNVVVTVVEDASSNASYSANTIVVEDQAPPQILAEPQSGTNLAGATVTLSVTAAACTPLAFQWCSNSVALQGATNRSLVLSNVSLASTADYWVVTTAAGGSTTSAVATLTVVLNPTLVALDSTSNPSGYRGDLYLSVTATPASATGTVQFQTNGVTFDTEPLVAGLATSTNVSFLPRGTNVVTVLYPGDANDLPAASSFEQIVTNHPPVAADAYYTRASGGSLNIVIADLTTNWADVDGDTVSLVAVSVSTNGVSLTNDSGTLVYFNTNDVADQFTCTLSDGWGGTNYQTVNIAMEAPVNPTPSIIGASTSPGGGFNLSLAGAPGYSYILEAAIDLSSLSNWLSVATNTLATNGVWQFTDPQATNFPQRFYRLRLGP